MTVFPLISKSVSYSFDVSLPTANLVRSHADLAGTRAQWVGTPCRGTPPIGHEYRLRTEYIHFLRAHFKRQHSR